MFLVAIVLEQIHLYKSRLFSIKNKCLRDKLVI